MKITEIKSYKDLSGQVNDKDLAYVLIYKKGSELSECAFNNINEAFSASDADSQQEAAGGPGLYTVNVAEVRDVHEKYSVTSAPTLLSLEKGELKNTYKGCNDKVYYKNIFDNLVFKASAGTGKAQKRVTVYSTPSCSWCNTLKSYFRNNGVRFTDIDVSKDQKAAENMVRRSGQQGVPQTDINGQVIVGFDKDRINSLLGIEG